MTDHRIADWIRGKYEALSGELTERARRRWCAVEDQSLGRGGVSAVSAASGIARSTIRRGMRELAATDLPPADRQRHIGGGRKRADVANGALAAALDRLVEPDSRGDPQSPLRWTCKNTRRLAAELTKPEHPVGPTTVRHMLREAGYSVQANRKTREETSHPDRDRQFRHIHRRASAQQRSCQPVISVETKKKEVLGDLKNPGRIWRPKGQPLEVGTHDFPDPKKGQGRALRRPRRRLRWPAHRRGAGAGASHFARSSPRSGSAT